MATWRADQVAFLPAFYNFTNLIADLALLHLQAAVVAFSLNNELFRCLKAAVLGHLFAFFDIEWLLS